jgi:ABC-2 type transport system permease protein
VNALRLFAVFARLGLQQDLAYRGNFLVQVLQSGLELATALGTLAIVFSQTSALAGWRPAELVAVLGVYFTMASALEIVVSPSLSRFIEAVRDGALDHTLIKPVDAQLLVSIQEVRVLQVVDLAFGGSLLAIALYQLSTQVTAGALVAFAIALAAAAAIVYSVWLLLATLAFWFIRIENILMVFWSLYAAGRWPVSIYPGWLRWLLTAVVPVAFAVTVPAEVVAGRLSGPVLLAAVGLAALLLVASRAFWRSGLRHYSGASA